MPRTWFSIRALADDTAEVSIYDAIGLWGVSASDFVSALKDVAGKALTVRINSPGGAITEGTAIFNALKRHDGEVTTCIDGLAASMASYVALAGSRVCMAENAFFMIHNPQWGAQGDADELRSAANVLDKMKATLVNVYAAKTGMDDDDIGDLMDAETWLTAAEAKEKGFIDEITEPIEAVALFDPSALKAFRKLPSALAPVDRPATAMSTETLQATIADLTRQLAEMTSRHAAAAQQAQTNFASLTEARAQLATLTTERDTAQARITALETEVTGLKASSKSAGELAAEINGTLGVPPVSPDTAKTTKGSLAEIRARFDAERDPKKRAAIYLELEAAMDTAASAQHRR